MSRKFPAVSDERREAMESTSGSIVRFRGRTMDWHTRGYTFVDCESVTQIEGPDTKLPFEDLMLHIKQNQALGEPIRENSWITFFIQEDDRRASGIEVWGAEYEQKSD